MQTAASLVSSILLLVGVASLAGLLQLWSVRLHGRQLVSGIRGAVDKKEGLTSTPIHTKYMRGGRQADIRRASGVISLLFLCGFLFLPYGGLPAHIPGPAGALGFWLCFLGGSWIEKKIHSSKVPLSHLLISVFFVGGGIVLFFYSVFRGIPGTIGCWDMFIATPLWSTVSEIGFCGLGGIMIGMAACCVCLVPKNYSVASFIAALLAASWLTTVFFSWQPAWKDITAYTLAASFGLHWGKVLIIALALRCIPCSRRQPIYIAVALIAGSGILLAAL